MSSPLRTDGRAYLGKGGLCKEDRTVEVTYSARVCNLTVYEYAVSYRKEKGQKSSAQGAGQNTGNATKRRKGAKPQIAV